MKWTVITLWMWVDASALPSHESLVWTGHRRRPLWPHLWGWAFPQCSHAHPAGPPGAAGALARSGWGVGYLSPVGKKKVSCCTRAINKGIKYSIIITNLRDNKCFKMRRSQIKWKANKLLKASCYMFLSHLTAVTTWWWHLMNTAIRCLHFRT